MIRKWALLPIATATGLLLAGVAAAQSSNERSAYSYIRMMTGEATVNSRSNGEVEARRNMPISVGDEISVSEAGRVEVGTADGNIVFLGGGTRASFESLSDQQGDDAPYSALRLIEGELVLSGLGADENQIPRVDTDDATIYVSQGSHVRINADSRRGTVVVGRAGAAEVRTPAGTYTIKAGQYLMVRGEEEPEIARGAFSRDRFDLWVAERLESLQGTRSVAVGYVGDQYANDVASLDGYGDWQYDGNYGGDVWSPNVSADWSPYSNGSWYYTPAGLTWWSNDPWGWYPFHYGNWFFARNRWCWAPGYAYSPAWVYWGYSAGYVGWCPIGYYSFYSPWWNLYYNGWGIHHRSNVYFAVHGTFGTHGMDFRGWNFVPNSSFGGTVTRASVIPGSRIGDRLGSQVAISSRPIVVNAREGAAREAIRNFVREAPRTIERTSSPDSSRLAPVFARERVLPADTQAALRERTVVAERGRLSGPAVAEIAPRGAIVERSRPAPATTTGREAISGERRSLPADRGIAPSETALGGRDRGPAAGPARVAPRAADDSWRGRGGVSAEARDVAPRDRTVVPDRGLETRPAQTRPAPRADSWRSRSDVPPAQRVIEGAVPGRAPETRSDSWRGQPQAIPRERFERPPVERAPSSAPPPARMERPTFDRAPSSAPPPARMERPMVDRRVYSAPPPARMERQRIEPAPERMPYSPPPARFERPSSPPPARIERAPAPAPAPRAEVQRETGQRPAPAPHAERERRH